MAKKATTTPTIKSEKQGWGVRLSLRPFAEAPYEAMEITADVAKPKPGRGAEIKVWFSSPPIATPLRITDLLIWIEAIRAMEVEARATAEKLKK